MCEIWPLTNSSLKFGDFANGAQVIIDTMVSGAEGKLYAMRNIVIDVENNQMGKVE